ncbi:MAG TPA: hypothetical protein PLU22_17170 [Polyangiaceae bacterium]|nr:hypothetical protein [Polyangiaceae bacterium]
MRSWRITRALPLDPPRRALGSQVIVSEPLPIRLGLALCAGIPRDELRLDSIANTVPRRLVSSADLAAGHGVPLLPHVHDTAWLAPDRVDRRALAELRVFGARGSRPPPKPHGDCPRPAALRHPRPGPPVTDEKGLTSRPDRA